MPFLLIAICVAIAALWSAALLREPRREQSWGLTLLQHTLAIVIGAGTGFAFFRLIRATVNNADAAYSGWHAIPAAIVGLAFWMGLAAYWRGRYFFVPATLAVQVGWLGLIVFRPFHLGPPHVWGARLAEGFVLVLCYLLFLSAGIGTAIASRAWVVLSIQLTCFVLAASALLAIMKLD